MQINARFCAHFVLHERILSYFYMILKLSKGLFTLVDRPFLIYIFCNSMMQMGQNKSKELREKQR